MRLFDFMLEDYEELVDMYYEFNREVYPDRLIGHRYFYYKTIMEWIHSNKDVIIVKKNGTIVGFSMSFVNDNGGLTETVYSGEMAYVKPEYRKTRAAYLLYRNVSEVAIEKKLTLVANGLATNGVSDMIRKHFDCKEMFTNFERTYNG
jgi:hypothetical protein